MFWDVLQFAISINLESAFFLWYILFLPIQAGNNSVMCSKIHVMPWLPNMQDKTLWILSWCSFSGCGTERRSCVCPYRLPISYQWMSAINWNLDCPRCKAKNCWYSVNTHSQNGAVTVLLSLLPIKAANTSLMHNCDEKHCSITILTRP